MHNATATFHVVCRRRCRPQADNEYRHGIALYREFRRGRLATGRAGDNGPAQSVCLHQDDAIRAPFHLVMILEPLLVVLEFR